MNNNNKPDQKSCPKKNPKINEYTSSKFCTMQMNDFLTPSDILLNAQQIFHGKLNIIDGYASTCTSTSTSIKPSHVMSSKEVILNNIKLIDAMVPSLSSHIYSRLFLEDADNDNDKNNKIENTENVDYAKYFEENCRNMKLETFLQLISISKSEKRFMDKFLHDDNIDRYYNQTDDISSNYDISNPENLNNVVSVSKQNFMDVITETYSNDEMIMRQFLADFPRQDVFINGKRFDNMDKLFLELSICNAEIDIDNKHRKKLSKMMLCFLLICQSSFYISFLHVYNKIAKLRSILNIKYGISDNDKTSYRPDQVDKLPDSRYNLHIADHKERNVIDIKISPDNLKCSLMGCYRIVDLDTTNTLYLIRSETLFDINNDTCLIIYETCKP